MALEVGYHFHLVGPLNNYMVFSKYGDIKQTIIELLDWISGLELVETESKLIHKKITYNSHLQFLQFLQLHNLIFERSHILF